VGSPGDGGGGVTSTERARVVAEQAVARVILVDGMLAAFVRGDRDVTTFLPPDEPARSAARTSRPPTITSRWSGPWTEVHVYHRTVALRRGSGRRKATPCV